jgi:thymidylate synthase (FAD)
MNVKLVSVTESYIEEAKLSPEDLIVYTARVSNPSNQLNLSSADKLLAYLIKHKHWSPFEMVDMCVEIKTSRAIAQQILRHRSFSFQEFSQRYSEVVELEPIEMRYKADTNRQSSSLAVEGEDKVYIDSLIARVNEVTTTIYSELLMLGIAKECARFILPLHAETTIYMKGSVRSWIHYLQIRCDDHTQLEHRLVAEEIRDIFNKTFPNIALAMQSI